MKQQHGFTLMETLIYLALFSIIIGGGLVAAYGIIEGTNRNASSVAIMEDANFLLRKIDWMLTGVDPSAGGVASPSSGSSATLSVNKLGESDPLHLTLDGSNIELQRGSASPQELNSSTISVSSLTFTRISSPGLPDAIRATFTISSSLSGMTVSENFETTKYLR